MGQKVHPVGYRLGHGKEWDAKWYSEKNMPDLIQQDLAVRKYVKEKLYNTGVGKIMIERAGNSVRVNIHTARPGIVIGKRGMDIEKLRGELENITNQKTYINIIPIKKPELSAQIIAEEIAGQMEKKIFYRSLMKKAIVRTMAAGAGGVKIRVGGRLAGAEIARVEWLKEGRVPLQTIRADIDYGSAESLTTYGRIGVKVWVYMPSHPAEQSSPAGAVRGQEKTAGQEEKKNTEESGGIENADAKKS